jgi:hypothetical protein
VKLFKGPKDREKYLKKPQHVRAFKGEKFSNPEQEIKDKGREQ